VPWAWTKEEPSAEEEDGVRDAAIGENTVGVFLNRTTARGCRRGKRGMERRGPRSTRNGGIGKPAGEREWQEAGRPIVLVGYLGKFDADLSCFCSGRIT